MLAGELYDGFNADLRQERCHARRLLRAFNNSGAEEAARRADLLGELFGRPAENAWVDVVVKDIPSAVVAVGNPCRGT